MLDSVGNDCKNLAEAPKRQYDGGLEYIKTEHTVNLVAFAAAEHRVIPVNGQQAFKEQVPAF